MEDFVTYEQAVKLKELWFDKPCRYYYNSAQQLLCAMECVHSPEADRMATAPTLSQAAKWLREVKGIYIEVCVRDLSKFEVYGKVIGKLPTIKYLFDLWDYENPYPTYEAALSAGIDEALELIK